MIGSRLLLAVIIIVLAFAVGIVWNPLGFIILLLLLLLLL